MLCPDVEELVGLEIDVLGSEDELTSKLKTRYHMFHFC